MAETWHYIMWISHSPEETKIVYRTAEQTTQQKFYKEYRQE